MAADDPPSLFHPLTPLVVLMRAAAGVGLTVPAATLLGRASRRAHFLRPSFGDFRPGAKDVIVATFPKSGTNLVLQIAQQLAWRGAAEFTHIHDVVPWPDAPSRKVVRLDATLPPSVTGHRIIKTHLPESRTPWDGDGVCLVVVRDPKEVVVSAYWFVMGLLGLVDRVTPEQWVEIFRGDGLPFGSWAEHLDGWWTARHHPRVHILNFRELVRDLPAAVDRIAAAMGIEPTEAERAAVVERAGLPWMKAHEAQFAPMPLPGRGRAGRPRMIRRGIAGASDEFLTPEAQRGIDADALEELEALGSDFPYREWFDSA